jgi:hypothetical protein
MGGWSPAGHLVPSQVLRTRVRRRVLSLQALCCFILCHLNNLLVLPTTGQVRDCLDHVRSIQRFIRSHRSACHDLINTKCIADTGNCRSASLKASTCRSIARCVRTAPVIQHQAMSQ